MIRGNVAPGNRLNVLGGGGNCPIVLGGGNRPNALGGGDNRPVFAHA